MLENQERAFKIFRVKIIGKMRERDNLLRTMNKRIEMLEVTWRGLGSDGRKSPQTQGRDGWKLKQSHRKKHHGS